MALDPLTLLALTANLAIIVGLLLLLSWAQNRAYVALAYWGAGDVAAGLGIVGLLFRGVIPDWFSIAAANAVLAFAYGMMWAACRLFGGRRARMRWIGAGALVWLVACSVPAFLATPSFRLALFSAIVAAYSSGALRELWHDRSEHLVSRMPAVVWLFMHAGIYVIRIPLALFGDVPATLAAQSPWFTLVTFEGLIHVVAMAVLMVSMAKERSESEQQKAASTDELTGAASRRRFMVEGERRLETTRREGSPATLLLLDLDRFKLINDTYGHAAGDRVLRAFAALAASILRPGDLFGRLGGEEFAVLVVPADASTGFAIGERFCEAAASLDVREDNLRIGVSVSVGIATATAACGLADLLKRADGALYEAKAQGRNCVRASRERVAHLRAVG